MLTIDKSEEQHPDFQRGYLDAMDGVKFGRWIPGTDTRYRKGYVLGQCDRDDVNKRLSRVAQRFDDGEFQGKGEYLVAVTKAVAGK
jgi:hypothetical protein